MPPSREVKKRLKELERQQAAHRDAMANLAISKRKESERLEAALVGRTIKSVVYDNTNGAGQPIEGVYSLELDNGDIVTFSSSGDDATFTYMDIFNRKGTDA